MEKPKRRRWIWAAVASATCLLVGTATLLILPAVQASREAAHYLQEQEGLEEALKRAAETQRPAGTPQHSLLHDMYGAPNANAIPQGHSAGYLEYVEGPTGPVVPPTVHDPQPDGQPTVESSIPPLRPTSCRRFTKFETR